MSGGRCARATNWSARPSGTVVLDATAGSDAGVDIVSSEYATVAAEQTALENLSETVADQIVARLALYARAAPAGEVKAAKGSIDRAVDQPNRDIRFYLFHGQDESQSRALAARVAEALSASRFLISAASIKADPASLADEAGAMNLFGGTRVVWIEPATKDIEEGVIALLEGAGDRKSGDRNRRLAAEDLGAAEAGRRLAAVPRLMRPTCPRARKRSGW